MIPRTAINSTFSIQSYQTRITSKIHFSRCFASQTLLSRTDYRNRSTSELQEELNKRGIVTPSKKRSILIDKLVEFERGRTISVTTQKATEDISGPFKIKPKKETNPKKLTPEGSETTIMVSSPTKLVARLMSEPDGETPKSTPIQTGSNSASLASPLTTLKSAGHEAKTWPASINLPATPVDEPLGTVIPFIPNNWNSHQQSHAPQLMDIKPSSTDLQVSTASHPSTLPEGGPSLIATNQFSSNVNPIQASTSAETNGLKKNTADTDWLFSNIINSSSLVELIWSKSNTSATQSGRFEFEDRALNDRERTGLYQLIAFLSGCWVFAGLVDH